MAMTDADLMDIDYDASGGGTYKYFSYGSNSTTQLAKRVGRNALELITHPGVLKNHARIFAGYSTIWKGAVSSVHPMQKVNTYGMITELDQKDLLKLDKFEGGYTRKSCTVYDRILNSDVVCQIYFKNEKTFDCLPDISYLNAIRQMLDETNMPHRNKMIIRRLSPAGKVVKIGSWETGSQKIDEC
jgi:hypothetical protein